MKSYNDPIPLSKFAQFHNILCASGGRYLRNPYKQYEVVVVSYELDSTEKMVSFQKAWALVTKNMREIRKDQWWRKVIRRLST